MFVGILITSRRLHKMNALKAARPLLLSWSTKSRSNLEDSPLIFLIKLKDLLVFLSICLQLCHLLPKGIPLISLATFVLNFIHYTLQHEGYFWFFSWTFNIGLAAHFSFSSFVYLAFWIPSISILIFTRLFYVYSLIITWIWVTCLLKSL